MQLDPEALKMLMMSGPVRDPNDPRIYERGQQMIQGMPSTRLDDPMQAAPAQQGISPELIQALIMYLKKLEMQGNGPEGQNVPFLGGGPVLPSPR
jgi:hypothetical protein